jgi:hypothetical protein
MPKNVSNHFVAPIGTCILQKYVHYTQKTWHVFINKRQFYLLKKRRAHHENKDCMHIHSHNDSVVEATRKGTTSSMIGFRARYGWISRLFCLGDGALWHSCPDISLVRTVCDNAWRDSSVETVAVYKLEGTRYEKCSSLLDILLCLGHAKWRVTTHHVLPRSKWADVYLHASMVLRNKGNVISFPIFITISGSQTVVCRACAKCTLISDLAAHLKTMANNENVNS